MNYHVMTIDPGVSGTGFAIWDRKAWKDQMVASLEKRYFLKPKYCGTISYKNTTKHITMIKKLCSTYKVISVFVEDAAAMQGAKGKMVSNSGRLVVLAEFIGRFQEMLSREGIRCQLVPVAKWKGNLPKEVVARRVRRIWPGCNAKSHAIDAVGIGYYLTGCTK